MAIRTHRSDGYCEAAVVTSGYTREGASDPLCVICTFD